MIRNKMEKKILQKLFNKFEADNQSLEMKTKYRQCMFLFGDSWKQESYTSNKNIKMQLHSFIDTLFNCLYRSKNQTSDICRDFFVSLR